ncbi:MAG: fimbrillin family protein [Rikenella sp.]|nr:fimbrillin family protein [Rikenella sp.]
MKKQTILILFLSSMALTGCDLEKKSGDDGAVRFAAYQPSSEAAGAAVTKVTGTRFDAEDEITVFAPLAGNPINGQYDNNVPNGANGVGKGGRDMRYVADNSNRFTAKTEGDKIRYSSKTARLDFYAVYPAVGPAPKYAVVDQTDYTIDLGDISRQDTPNTENKARVVPYIYSNNAKGKGTEDGVVTLIFRNVLSKIVIDVKYDRLTLEGDLTKIEFSADGGLYRECEIDLKKGDYRTVATNGGREVLATKEDPYRFSVPTTWGTDGTWTTGSSEGVFVPGRATNPVIRLTFGDDTPTVNVDTNGSTVGSNLQTFICRIPTTGTGSTVNFEAGKMYTYTVEITGTMPEVSVGGTIEDWQAAGGWQVIEAE